MAAPAPRVIVLAGPNGAGKSTSARTILAETLSVMTFVNADVIAQGLSGFAAETTAMEAGRIMLRRLNQLAAERGDFAFETTLAGRAYAPWLQSLKATGYRVGLIYFWLESPELAVARVAQRVREGGHSIPETVIRQRFQRSVDNLFRLYRPLATFWQVYDNSWENHPRLIACGDYVEREVVLEQQSWNALRSYVGS
ncbi:MAG: zeta toxin family protein [Planctomycetia bacterium]|nr:zeta toxin family protein [Planctomycetia bacterium]